MSFKLADMATEMKAAELLTWEAGSKFDSGQCTDSDMAMAKLKASEVLAMVADEAIQIHGGMGLMDELPLERIWRDARIERIMGRNIGDSAPYHQPRAVASPRRMSPKVSGLERLLNPRSIAVIGGKEAERVVEQCDKLGFSGTIWPIHPTRQSMLGRPCLRSIDALPQAPDAAYVAVNRELSIRMVEDLAAIGAGGAVCYAAGFAEADQENKGSQDLQQRLISAAGDMPIIGPNCYGFRQQS